MAAGDTVRPVKMPARRRHDAFHFLALQWLRKHVVTPAIQNLRPKLFVGGLTCDDQLRLRMTKPQQFEDPFPVPFAEFPAGNDYLHLVAIHALLGSVPIGGLEQKPALIAKDFAEKPPAFRVFAQEKSTDREFARCFHRSCETPSAGRKSGREMPDFARPGLPGPVLFRT